MKRTRTTLLPRAALTLFVAAIVVAGCRRNTDVATDTKEAGAHRTAEGEGVTLTLAVDQTQAPFDQSVEVTIEAVAHKGIDLDLKDYALTIDSQPFGYKIARTHPAESAVLTEDGRLRWNRRYTLEFYVPGEHTLPAAQAVVVLPEADETLLETETITLEAQPTEALDIPEEKLAELTLPDPVTPAAKPQPRRWWPWATALGAAAALALVICLMRRRRDAPAPQAPPVPPTEWAHRALEALLAENLLARGRVQEFYFRLSGIVREFLERRFHFSAPEMTTEEFLAAAVTAESLGVDNKMALGSFLEACDRVKFALYEPDREELERAIEAARRFFTLSAREAQGTRA